MDNVYGPIIHGDEYGLNECRFEPEDVIIDIGAHIGTFTYLCYLKGSRAIHSFEPALRNFAMLQCNVGSLDGVHLYRSAIWRCDCGDDDLKVSGPHSENTGANSVVAGGRCIDFAHQTFVEDAAESSQVAAAPLDGVLERFDRVKLLKLDCEGSEFPILLTSNGLHRVERAVGEVHEMDEKIMSGLDARSRVDGYPCYRLSDLTSKLESCGFSVSARRGAEHMYFFDARRIGV